MYNALRQALVAFDEYPVENFHSVLRGRTNATDDNQISLKAKQIEGWKHELHSFKSIAVPPKKFNFSRKNNHLVKSKGCWVLNREVRSAAQLQPWSGWLSCYPENEDKAKKFQSDDYQTCLETKWSPADSCHLGFTTFERAPNPEM